MRFVVESWSPDYGAPTDALADDEEERRGKVDAFIERLPGDWAPIAPPVGPAETVTFVDGVQRIDARFWTDDDGISRMGICVSLAAGLVRCDGAATIENVIVRRAALGPPELGTIDCSEQISYRGVPIVDSSLQALQKEVGSRRDDLEVDVALHAQPCDLLVVDGHIRRREAIENAVGVLKTHQARYLELGQERVVGRLGAGERTPVFFMQTERWSGYSWYLRLPGGQGHPWAGIVRCEANPKSPLEAFRLADLTAATLPRFASNAYKDTRAPQNLYPIGGLEREMRRRLGDQMYLLRALQRAGAISA